METDTDRNLPQPLPTAAPTREVAPDPLIGRTLGGYVVKECLGIGGMGMVYLAEHQTIGRRAAVKFLKPEIAADTEWTRRFLTEARALAALKHRNLVEIFEFGETPDKWQYLMMEYIEGQPLDAYLREQELKGNTPLAPAVALGFAEQILNALGEAHKKGVVHRDLKPANVMVVREHNGESLLKLVDFGLARQDPAVLTGGAREGQASLMAGTPEYVAPEQAQGQMADGRADLYALGVMLYEMLAGRLPFRSDNVTELVRMQVYVAPPPLSGEVQNLPEGVDVLVRTLLEKSPEGRPASADVARQTIQRILKQLTRDATAVRGVQMPAAAPGAAVSAGSKHAPTMKIERPRDDTDKALAAAMPKGSPWPWVAMAVAAVVLVSLMVMLSRGSDEKVAVAKPVVEPPKVAVVAPKVEPVKGPEASVGQAPIQPLPEVPAKPAEPAVVAKVPVEEKRAPVEVKKAPEEPAGEQVRCRADVKWKKGMADDLASLGTAVAKKSKAANEEFEKGSKELGQKVTAAATPKDCAAVETAYRALYSRLESMP